MQEAKARKLVQGTNVEVVEASGGGSMLRRPRPVFMVDVFKVLSLSVMMVPDKRFL